MPLYRDYAGYTFDSLDQLAGHRTRVQAPLLDGAVCPAAEYTFAVSEDGLNWRNPGRDTLDNLALAITLQDGCCRNLGQDCPTKKTARPGSA